MGVNISDNHNNEPNPKENNCGYCGAPSEHEYCNKECWEAEQNDNK